MLKAASIQDQHQISLAPEISHLIIVIIIRTSLHQIVAMHYTVVVKVVGKVVVPIVKAKRKRSLIHPIMI